MRANGILNAFVLKIIMLVLMVFDHLYYYLFPEKLLFAHYLSRIVAPVFVYLMTQGMVFTRNRRSYILRMMSFGALMAAVNFMLTLLTGIRIPNNIFLSLGFSALLILSLDKIIYNENRPAWVCAAILAVLAALNCEGSYIIPLTSVIFYYLRNSRMLMYATFVILMGLPYFLTSLLSQRIEAQLYMILAVIPIMFYNGERGPDTAFAKYFFYIFYPAHIWTIVFVKSCTFTALG